MARTDDETSARDLGKDDPQQRERGRMPGKTPGQAEGDRETVEHDLRKREQARRGR